MTSNLAAENSPLGDHTRIEPRHPNSVSDAVASRRICSSMHRILAKLFRKALPCLASSGDTDDEVDSREVGVVTARVMMAIIGGQDDLPGHISNACPGINVTTQNQVPTPSCSARLESSTVEPLTLSHEIYSTIDDSRQMETCTVAAVGDTIGESRAGEIEPSMDMDRAPSVLLGGTKGDMRYSPEELKVMVSRPSSLDILASLDTLIPSSLAQSDPGCDPFNTAVEAIVTSCSGSSSLQTASNGPVSDPETADTNTSRITAIGSNPIPTQMSIAEFNQQQEKIHEYRLLGGSADTMIMYLANRRERRRQAEDTAIMGVLRALSIMDSRIQAGVETRGLWPADADEEKVETTWVDHRPFYFCPPPSLASSSSRSDMVAAQEADKGVGVVHLPTECLDCLNICPTCAVNRDTQAEYRELSSSKYEADMDAVLELKQPDTCVLENPSGIPADNTHEETKHKNKIQNRQLNIYDLSIYYPQENTSNRPNKKRKRQKKKTSLTFNNNSKEDALKAYLSATKVVTRDKQKVQRWLVKQSQVIQSLSNGDEILVWRKMTRHRSAPSFRELKKPKEENQHCRRRASVIGHTSAPDPFLQSLASHYTMREFSNFLSLSPTVPPSAALEGHASEMVFNSENERLSIDLKELPTCVRQLLDEGTCAQCVPSDTSSNVTRKLLSSTPASMMEPAPRKPLRAKRIRGKFISEVIPPKDNGTGKTEGQFSGLPVAFDRTSPSRNSSCSDFSIEPVD